MAFFCGAAREIITPPIGTCLYGYEPGWHSDSLHDDLTATAAAFSNGTETALLISLTVGDIQTELDAEMRGEAGKAASVPAENVLICATHTHSAPNVAGFEGWGEIDREYVDGILLPAIRKAAGDAVRGMKSAKAGYASGDSYVGINRRQQMRDGSIALGQNPHGMFDPTMTVLSFKDENGRGIFNLIHYGCHGTACGKNREITRDWSGVMIDRVERETGTLTAFYNGAIGDVGPRLTNGSTCGDIRHVEELGGVAAMDAMRIYRQIRAFSAPDMKVKKGEVHLPHQAYPALSDVRRELASIEHPETLVNLDRLRYQHLADIEKKLASGDAALPADYTLPMTQIILGDTVFIPFPFEFFSEISLRLREYSGYQNTLCLSNTGGYNGYLPTQDQLCRGGYEIGVFRYARVDSLADNTDQNIINESLRILEA